MVDNEIPNYAALLKEHYLFKGLDEAQIAHVVIRFKRIDKDAGEVIISEGDIGSGFYIIFQGKVNVTRREDDGDKQLDVLGPEDYFGEEGLLFDRPRSATITAITPVIILRLDREDFFELLDDYPLIRKNLSATAESREIAQKVNFDWLGVDEVIYLVIRKHEFFLVTSLILPVIIGVAAIPALLYGISVASGFLSSVIIFFGLLALVFSAFWFVWRWIDWGNDYYVVTNQRVVWQERVIIFYQSRREAPLTQVLAVNVTRSWLGRQIFDFGDIDVRTFTGSIPMVKAANPGMFAYFVEGFQVRAQHLMKQVEADAMETALRTRLGLGGEGAEGEEKETNDLIDEPTEPPPAPEVKPSWFREKLETFLQVRYERDGVITYRKHWMLLLRRTLWPNIFFALLLVITIYLGWDGYRGGDASAMSTPFLCFFVFLYIAVILWWIYDYVDWSNDIYQLTPTQIFDIERRPLGEEQKKSAPLESILSIEHSRDGLIQLMLNYGNVIINVGTTKFVFRGVYHPDDVHQDVSDYIEAGRRRKQQKEAERDRLRMADWFATYHEQSKDLNGGNQSRGDWERLTG